MNKELNINFKPTAKQHKAFEYLKDQKTFSILFGGAASGGKSFLLCAWLILSAIQYKQSTWLLGRSTLSVLKQSTLQTFFGVCKEFGLINDKHYKYNDHKNMITFTNGSIIFLKDLEYKPSDPEYVTSLSGLELWGAGIDEASEITEKCYNIICSRIRSKDFDKYGIKGKVFLTTNPSKNWIKKVFYDPFKEGTLPEDKQFIQSLITDNTAINTEDYKKILEGLDEVSKQRLLFGNWDYADDELTLFDENKLNYIFNSGFNLSNNRHYLTIDPARLGRDKSVVFVWNGLSIIDYKVFQKTDLATQATEIKNLIQKYKVNPTNICVDSDGVGGGLCDMLPKGIKAFMNNGKAVNNENYSNIKTQCYFKVSELDFTCLLGKDVIIDGKNMIDELKSDLSAIRKKITEGKLAINSKEDQKKVLGRSPDFADAIMLRAYFEVKKNEFYWTTSSKKSVMDF